MSNDSGAPPNALQRANSPVTSRAGRPHGPRHAIPPLSASVGPTPFGRRFMNILEEVHRLQQVVDKGRMAASARNENESKRDSRRTGR
jgi:hypothetical protein